MKTKYTLTVNGIKAELEFDEVTALDRGYVTHQIEEQYRLLNNINKEPVVKSISKVQPDLTKTVENLFVDSLKELAEEFNQNKNKNNFSAKK